MIIAPTILVLLVVVLIILTITSWIAFSELKEEKARKEYWQKRLDEEKEENSKLREKLNEEIIAHSTIIVASSSEWYQSDIILNNGNVGIDSTNNIFKIGNGRESWIELEKYDFERLEDIPIAQIEELEQGRSYFGSNQNWVNE